MELIDVVRKLVGPIRPVGETNEDNRRFENLKVLEELLTELLADLERVAYDAGRVEFSMKRAGEFARKIQQNLGLPD